MVIAHQSDFFFNSTPKLPEEELRQKSIDIVLGDLFVSARKQVSQMKEEQTKQQILKTSELKQSLECKHGLLKVFG